MLTPSLYPASPLPLSTIVRYLSLLLNISSNIPTILVGAVYNFTGSGAGSYSFAAVNRFHYVDESGAPVELFAEHPEAHVTDVSGKLAVARPTKTKRATYDSMSKLSNESM